MDKKTKKSIFIFQIFSAIFVMILGTFLHFAFDCSNKNIFIGAISAVNESTWEHLKLIFYPTLFSIIIGCFYFKNSLLNFLCCKTIGIITSILFIVIFFYVYTGILGFNIDILNIASFFIAVILGEYVSYYLIINTFPCNSKISLIILLVLTLLFIIFTYSPPKIALFKNPIDSSYGIYKKL